MTAHDVYSRNKGTASIDFPHRPDHHFTGFIIVLTYEFKTLYSRTESDPPPGFPRRCVGAGVIDRHFVPHGVEVRMPKASGRFATRVGFKLVGLAIVVDGPRPGLEGNLIQRGLSWILVLFTRGRGSRRWDTDCESPSCNVPQAAFFADRRSPIHCAVR